MNSAIREINTAEISIPYVRRQLARGVQGGGSGGGLGVVPLPRIPDTSRMLAPAQQIGQSIEDVGDVMGQIAAKQRKARDVATLTEFEVDFDKDVGLHAVDVKSNANIHPDDWAKTIDTYREDLFKERSVGLPSHLVQMARARSFHDTNRTIIDAKADGAVVSQKQAMTALNAYEDQKLGRMLTETDPAQQKMLRDQLNAKYDEYQAVGRLSANDRLERTYKADQRLLETGAEMDMQRDGKGTLEALQSGEYAGLAPETRVKLIDKAQGEYKAQLELQDQQDRRNERVAAARQSETSSALRDQVYKMGGGTNAIKLISEARANRDISEGDHSALMGFAIAMQNHRDALATSAANRAAANAQRADIARRRAEDDQAGLLVAKYFDNRPGPDGQLPSVTGIVDAAIAGKLNGNVAGRTAQLIANHEQQLQSTANAATNQAFNHQIANAEAVFEQAGLRQPDDRAGVAQAWANFRAEFTAAVYEHGMDPAKAARDILPGHVATAEGLLDNRQRSLISELPPAYKTSPEIGIIPALTQLQRDFMDGILPKDKYDKFANYLKELENYPSFVLAGQKRKTTANAPTPEPTPAEPGAGERIRQQYEGSGLPAIGRGLRRFLPQLDAPQMTPE